MSNESNGGIMKIAILGTFAYDNLDTVIKNTIDVCGVTHPAPLCVYSCIVLNYIISNLIKTNERSEKFIFSLILDVVKNTKHYIRNYIDELNKNIKEISNENISDDIMTEVIKGNIAAYYNEHISRNTTEKVIFDIEYALYFENINMCDLQTNIGHTLNPLKCAIYGLRKLLKGESFEKIISDITYQGGDADTNCAVAGAVMGAYLGKSKLPQKYIKELIHKDILQKYVDQYTSVLGNI